MDRRLIYKKAYELAYMTVMNARSARSIAKIAFGQLDAALDQQYRRSYYRLRKVRAQELRDVDIIDPHGLALEVLRADSSLSKHLTKKFIKRDTLAAVNDFLNSHSDRVVLREKLTRDLNEAIFFGYLRKAEGMSSLAPAVNEDYRVSRQLINRQIIQKAFGRYLATNQHRNVVNLTDPQMLQLLVYSAAELYELEAEKAGDVSYEDLCIRYLKYLAKLSFKTNVFHTSLAYGALIYDYGRAGAKGIYEYAVQDSGRFRPDSNFSNLKAAIMRLLENERFAANYRLVREQALGAPSRFRRRAPCADELSRNLKWLARLALWLECIDPTEGHTSDESCKSLLTFAGNDPDDEHPVERRRIHTISCPRCFGWLALRAGLGNPHEHLSMPHFEATSEMKNDTDSYGRLHPPPIDPQELEDDLKEVDGLRALRRVITPSILSVRVDGVERVRLVRGSATHASFAVSQLADVLEIWGICEKNKPTEILLAAHFLRTPLQSSVTEVVSLHAAGSSLNLELTCGLESKVSLQILWQSASAASLTDYYENTKCLNEVRLAKLAVDPALANAAEEEHINGCSNCGALLQIIDARVHPTIATLLAFVAKNLESPKQYVEEHLRAGCRRCGTVLRARSFIATVSALRTHTVTLNRLRDFLRYSVAGIDRLPINATEYSVVRHEARPSYFGYFAQQEIVVTVEEAAEGEWLITAASQNTELDGRTYSVEVVGEQSSLLAEVKFRKEGEFYEGSTYVYPSAVFMSQAQTFTIFGALLVSELTKALEVHPVSNAEQQDVLEFLRELM